MTLLTIVLTYLFAYLLRHTGSTVTVTFRAPKPVATVSRFPERRQLDDRNYPVEIDRDGWSGALGAANDAARDQRRPAQVSADGDDR